MKKKTLFFTAILLTVLFALSACGGGENSQFHGSWMRWGENPQLYEFRRGGEGSWSDGRVIACVCQSCTLIARALGDSPQGNMAQVLMGDLDAEIASHVAPMTWSAYENRLEITISLPMGLLGDVDTTVRTYYFEFDSNDMFIIRRYDRPQEIGSIMTRLD